MKTRYFILVKEIPTLDKGAIFMSKIGNKEIFNMTSDEDVCNGLIQSYSFTMDIALGDFFEEITPQYESELTSDEKKQNIIIF